MANKLVLKKSSVASKVPLATDLVTGELAVNLADAKLYTKDAGGNVILVGSGSAAAGVSSFSAGTTGLTPSTASTGAVTLAGTLAVANGGTGATTVSGARTSLGLGTTDAVTHSDLTTARAAATTTGYVYYGNTGTKYAGFDGTNFVSSMPMNFNILGSSASCSGNAATATTATTANALNTGNSYTGANFTATGSFVVGSGGTYAAGSLYSDANWGMIFRAKQASPALAQFLWVDSAGAEVARLSTAGAFTATSFGGAGTGLTGTASSLSIGGNAATATTATNLSTTRSNWSTNGTITAVVGQLCWKNYGNGHTIFDASQSTSPDGSAVNNTNAQVAWTGSYPTLMGWNGANTYGVRVDSARVADNGGVTSVNGLTGAVTVTGAVAGGAIYENSQTISADYTVSSGKNALSAGPITIATGVTVTIPTGSTWVIA